MARTPCIGPTKARARGLANDFVGATIKGVDFCRYVMNKYQRRPNMARAWVETWLRCWKRMGKGSGGGTSSLCATLLARSRSTPAMPNPAASARANPYVIPSIRKFIDAAAVKPSAAADGSRAAAVRVCRRRPSRRSDQSRVLRRRRGMPSRPRAARPVRRGRVLQDQVDLVFRRRWAAGSLAIWKARFCGRKGE